MKHYIKMLLFAWLALTIVVFVPEILFGRTSTESQDQKAAAQSQEAEPEYSEEEYSCYDTATKEPDLQTRGTDLINCIQKYPQTKLMPYINAAYKTLLFDCSSSKKYVELEALAEQWLKLHPDDYETVARVAEAAGPLGHDDKYVQCLEKLYKMKPISTLPEDIARTHEKLNNKAKYIEWTETAIKLPENEANFMLRFNLVRTFIASKDYAKAAEYAQAALNSVALVKPQTSQSTLEQLRDVRHACYDIIGRNLIQKDKFAEAIASFREALKAKKYCEGYYYIALCLRNQSKIDDAMVFYAKAELQGGGEAALKAKEKLEQLYMNLHDGNKTGIQKIYNKAKELPESAENLK
jgi:tetratricopeptide (TPR) repeat protein